jgi:hypothetical protein
MPGTDRACRLKGGWSIDRPPFIRPQMKQGWGGAKHGTTPEPAPYLIRGHPTHSAFSRPWNGKRFWISQANFAGLAGCRSGRPVFNNLDISNRHVFILLAAEPAANLFYIFPDSRPDRYSPPARPSGCRFASHNTTWAPHASNAPLEQLTRPLRLAAISERLGVMLFVALRQLARHAVGLIRVRGEPSVHDPEAIVEKGAKPYRLTPEDLLCHY